MRIWRALLRPSPSIARNKRSRSQPRRQKCKFDSNVPWSLVRFLMAHILTYLAKEENVKVTNNGCPVTVVLVNMKGPKKFRPTHVSRHEFLFKLFYQKQFFFQYEYSFIKEMNPKLILFTLSRIFILGL